MGRLIDYKPVIPDYSRGLNALAEGIESYQDRKHKNRLAALEEQRAADARAYNEAQTRHLGFLEGQKRNEEQRTIVDREREGIQRMAGFGRAGAGPEAEAEARALGGTFRRIAGAAGAPPQAQAPRLSSAYTDDEVRGAAAHLFPDPDSRNNQLQAVADEAGQYDLPGMRRFGNRVAGMKTPEEAPETLPPTEAPPPTAQPAQGLQAFTSGKFRFERPGQEPIDFDPNDEQSRKTEVNKQVADTWLGGIVPGDDEDERVARQIHSRIVAGAGSAAQATAAWDAYQAQKRGQNFKHSEGMIHELTRPEKMEIGMRPRAAFGGLGREGKELGNEKKKLEIEQEYMDAAEKTLGKMGYVNIRNDERKLAQLSMAVAGADNNAALASIASGAFTKMAQGGTGVVSDQDFKVFWKDIGGLGIRTVEEFNRMWDGTLGKEKQAQVQDAVARLEHQMQINEAKVGERLTANLEGLHKLLKHTGPEADMRTERVLDTYAPSYLERWRARRANRGDTGAQQQFDDETDALLSRRRQR